MKLKIKKISISGFIRRKPFLRKMMPGIRFKFSFLIGIFISIILAAATYINYINQSSILQKSFDDETEYSLNYINPIVNTIDSIRSNLLLIEDMKIRFNEKSRDLKKYKTYARRRKDSVSNTFRNLGKKLGFKVRYDYYMKGYETYYSTYLSKNDISFLEKKTSARLKQSNGSEISGKDFKSLQNKARRIVIIRRRIENIQSQVDTNNEKLKLLSGDNIKEANRLKRENKKLERKFSAERKRIIAAERIFRNRLNRYYNYHLKNLDETGIYNSNIRIITYNSTGEVSSDTGSYFRESLTRFSPLLDSKDFAKDKSDFFNRESIFSSIKVHEYNYTIDNNYYHVRYVPVYRNPASSERLTTIITELDDNNRNWLEYLKEDLRISAEISGIADKIRARLETLRQNKKVPGKDKEFIALYSGYNKLLEERTDAFIKHAPYSDEMEQVSGYYNSKIKSISAAITDETEKIKALKVEKDNSSDEYKEDIESSQSAIADYKEEIKKLKIDMTDAREDIWQNRKLAARNSMRYIREAALYDYAIFKQKSEPGSYRNYLKSSRNRDIERGRWSTLRKWIISARSETDIPDYVYGMRNVKLADNGALAYSRSEIEEYMWSIDSTPIAGTIGFLNAGLENGVVENLLEHNITGFHSVLIDKTEGVENIARNRDRMIIYSIITAVIAIFMTYFLVGFMVKRVRNIIGAAQVAATGDLKVEFPEKGLDEIEDLAVSLNGMMSGLRDKEALEGEIAAAGEIQKTLLPKKIPSNLEGFYSIGTFYRSMQGVGGDYYDFIELDDESIFFCIADVSSHGVGPAIVMSMMRAHIHGILRRGVRDLVTILQELNRQIFIETPPHIFITFFAGIINKTGNDIEYCSAGHLKPVLYKYRTDSIEILEGGGLPVGMDDNDIFSETIEVRNVKLKPGDLFFQYTDGVSEAMDNKRNLFTEEKMYDEIKKYARGKPDFLIMRIAEAVESFTGKTIINSSSSELNDDIAMIAFKRTK